MDKKECRLLFSLLSRYADKYQHTMWQESLPHLREDKHGTPKKFYNKDVEFMEQAYDTLNNNCDRVEGLLNPQVSSALVIKGIRSEFWSMLE